MHPMRRISAFRLLLSIHVLVGTITTASSGVAAERAALAVARESITSSELKRHVEVLADDSFEGREAGSRGGRAASLYLAREFERHKLKPAGDQGTYFQSFFGNCRNVLGLIEGSDPELKQPYVVICGHYDHVGYGSRRNSNGPTGYIHNGADDNASGAAAVLEAIEAIVSVAEPPKRSILFALWDSEENGLNGSKHWVRNPTIPLGGITAAINLDMVGRLRNERLTIYGTRTSTGLRRLVCEANRRCDLLLDFDWTMNDDSDHHSFFAAGIPVMMFHTGLHEDYHRPSDDAAKVNAAGIERIARLLFNTTLALADAPQPQRFRSQSRQEFSSMRESAERALPPLPGRLGVQWRRPEPSDAEPGVRLETVNAGSAADRAGLKPDDRIVRFAGEPVDPHRFGEHVLAAPNPVEAEIRRPGEDEPRTVRLALTGQPLRVGIAWRVDEAEPTLVQIVRVTPGSPAASAGIRLFDRIYEVNGERFSSIDEFGRLMATDEPLKLLAETQGRMRMIELTPLKVGGSAE
ncbi:MAG: M20/M25/M40 family metallo-hydrolase [Pirellulales bacterium]